MKLHSNPFFAISVALLSATTLHATTYYWDGTDTTAAVPDANGGAGSWDTTLTNWNDAATAGSAVAWPSVTTLDDDAVFGGTAGTVIVDAAGVTANSLTFNIADYILEGGKITLNGTTPTIASAEAARINSEIGGTAGLTKTGAGALTLGTANTYTGITNISGGSIVAAHVNALPTVNTVNISTSTGAGTLRLATDSSVAALLIGASSSNQGTIISDRATEGTGITHVLGAAGVGANTYNFQAGGSVTSGTAGVSLASLNLSSGGGGTTTLNPTTATLTISGTVKSTTNSPKLLRLGGASTGNAINGVISNNTNVVSLEKSSSSTWTLAAANSYSGATTISGGTLRIANASALGDTVGATTVSSGATLAIIGDLAIGAEALSLNGNGVSNVGAINSISGVNSISGTVTLAGATRIGVEADTLELSSAISTTQGLTAVGAGKLVLSGGGSFGQLISGTSNVGTGGNLEWKTGTGTAAGTYFGVADNVSASFTISSGSLTVTPVNSLFVGSFSTSGVTGTMNVTGGTFTMNAAKPIYVGGGGYNGNVSGTGILNVSNGTFSTGTTTGTFRMGANAASQVGNGEINLSATGIIETARSITKGAQGTATVNFDGGTYKLSAAQGAMFGAGVVTNVNAGGATFDTNTFAGTIGTVLAAGSPSGGLTKQGAGTLTLTQANTYTGTTTISAGALQLGSGSTTGSLDVTSAIVNNGTLIINRSNAVAQGTDFSAAAITGGLAKLGAGSLTLNVANSQNATSIGSGSATAGGIVAVTHAQALGTGAITINGSNSIVATLQLSNDIAITDAGAISLAFSRNTIAGGGAAHIQNLSGNNSLNSNLNIASTGGAGANILSTAGTLTLTGNLNVTNGARVYTFSGAGDTIVSGNVLVGGAGTSNAVRKEGDGTLTLSGNANAYAGGTTVAGGTLLANNSSGSATGTGTVTVNSGGTLGGTGTISGATTVDGSLSPGAGVGKLTFDTGGLTLGTLAAGALKYELGAPTTAGTTYDTIDTSSLAIGAGLLNFASFQFNDAGTLAAGSYTLMSSTAPISGTLGTGLTGAVGAFTGTLSMTGNALILTVTTGSPLTTWATSNGLAGGDAAATADPDNDGLDNLIEFVIGGQPNPANPNADSSSLAPTVSTDGSNLIFTFRRTDLALTQPGITLVVEYGSDLDGWTPATDGVDGVVITLDEEIEAGVDEIQVSIPKILDSGAKMFARLNVVVP